MNLILDAGNTCIKAFIFSNNDIKNRFIFNYSNFIENLNKNTVGYNFEHIFIMGLTNIHKYLQGFDFDIFGKNTIFFDKYTKIPIENCYATPNTLGQDRIAAAVGASVIFPNCNVLIIDAGTCITFDYLDKGRKFLGGSISPGLKMRAKAMNYYTSALPQINLDDIDVLPKIANSTQLALQNGVVVGVINEIEGYINKIDEIFDDAKIILTGGDTVFLAKRLKNMIFAEPNLVAIGLNKILAYNVKTI